MHLNSFTQQECLGSLQRRLEPLYFCSMIFGYEALNQGRGREEIGPTSRDLFFSCSKPALFRLSEGFTQLFVKPKPTFSRGARGCVGLRSCCTGGLVSSPHPWLGCPWSQHSASAAFFPPSLPWHSPSLHPLFSFQKASDSSLVFTFSSGHQIRGSDF